MASAAQSRIKSISYAKYGYIFILPFFIVYCFFQLWPLIYTFILAFKGNQSAGDDFVGFKNFSDLLFSHPYKKSDLLSSDKEVKAAAKALMAIDVQHQDFVRCLKNTIVLWFGNFIPQIALSLSLAVWFTDAKLKIPGKGFFKVIMYMPNIITAASIAVLFLQLCADTNYSAATILGRSLGLLKDDEFFNMTKNIPSEVVWPPRIIVMFIQTWMWFGNTMIMLMSGIMGINPSLFEAASIDGASSGQTFVKITIPILSPILVYTVITSMIGGLQMFDMPYLFTTSKEGARIDNIETIAVYIYDKFHSGAIEPSYGYSGAASVVLFIITAVLGAIIFRINRDEDEHRKKKERKELIKQQKAKNKQFGGLSI